jgi:glycerol-3-phosphate dehydrogenase (NAD(P)+)
MGSGSWGTVFAKLLDSNSVPVRFWGNSPELIFEMTQLGFNPKYQSQLKFSNLLAPTINPATALAGVKLVVLAMPAQRLRSNLETWAADIPTDAVVLSLIKGLEHDSAKRISEVVAEFVPNEFAVLSGPNLAAEVAAGQFAAATVAANRNEVAAAVQHTCATDQFKIFSSNDVVGVEISGTTKNIIALATGIVIGLGLGENSQAAILTRGLAEMVRLGVAAGGSKETFLGLAGIGDLIATSQSPLSRNRSFGVLVGEGKSIAAAKDLVGHTVEAMASTKPILELAQKHEISVPIISHVAEILAELKPASSLREVFQTVGYESEQTI